MRKILSLVLVCCAAASSQMPYTFQAGSVAKADEVNANFTFLAGKIDSLMRTIDTLKQQATDQGATLTTLSLSHDSLMQLVDTLNANKLAIGTVIGTMVPIDTTTGIWVLADGRTATTEYFQATGENRVSDLRGLFLRGLNEGRNDGKQDPEGSGRTAGSYQEDTLKSHIHSLSNNMITGNGGLFSGGSYGAVNANFGATGGAETRGRNSAVYWYVKVR